MVNDLLPLILVLLSVSVAVVIFPLPEQAARLRSTVNIAGAVTKVVLVMLLVPVVVAEGARPEFSIPFLPTGDGEAIPLVLRVDPLALFFAGLSALLWLLTTIYAIGYLKGKPNRSRFFGFFSLCVAATVGLSFSGNLITFLVFYELLTLVTYPLVAHWGDEKSLQAAKLYMRYALGGGVAVLIGVVWLTMEAGPVDFAEGGAADVAELAATSPGLAALIFVLLIGGLGVKSALVPLHSWLPAAMVAPAPVSALLHAVAVVKAGVFGIVRVVDDVYGIEVAWELGVLTPLLVIASFTVIYGSYQALRQSEIKKRLAFSTVSQVSYVVLGVTMFSMAATAGGVVHLVHQGIMKITLFFCAGLFAEAMGAHKISELRGAGRRMPWTSVAFTIGAFGMIGLPPTAGFISKWQLGLGALESPHPWVLAVLVVSSLLNAAYFLPVVWLIWFGETPDPETDDDAAGGTKVREPAMLLVPAVCTAVITVGVGVAASLTFAPLEIARFIAEGVFS
ncbi:monovalent cation/H+ antiporter subunit D family protein [Nesterenkonia sp. MY13]|uniref:Monovalent cation/H+ antiporter subunit D family protein n=1 Tax=Nesterenkonia sedimenti TaxID=1463632 RepID=A0A7X8TLJ9_9MICC|nr:proton-conducting transporter membrane subunit [Nesterenkonia sedimenti]NLS10819.1 monovalent cation/H+ antiporter subunit D family protein [Nesterenkonia sedimenti]